MRIISLVDNDDLGLVAEQEVIGASERTMEVLVSEDIKMARVYDDTKPMVGKSVNKYEAKSYPIDRQVFKNDSIYISNKTTSETFILSEWDILVTGLNAQ